MQNRDNRVSGATVDRTVIELSIVATMLVVIVLAGLNSQSILSSINCRTPYIGSLCVALAER